MLETLTISLYFLGKIENFIVSCVWWLCSKTSIGRSFEGLVRSMEYSTKTQNHLSSSNLTCLLVSLQWNYSCHSSLGIGRMAGQGFTRACIHIPGDQKTLSEEAIFPTCFTPFFAIIRIGFCTVVSVVSSTLHLSTDKLYCSTLFLYWQRSYQCSGYRKKILYSCR